MKRKRTNCSISVRSKFKFLPNKGSKHPKKEKDLFIYNFFYPRLEDTCQQEKQLQIQAVLSVSKGKRLSYQNEADMHQIGKIKGKSFEPRKGARKA